MRRVPRGRGRHCGRVAAGRRGADCRKVLDVRQGVHKVTATGQYIKHVVSSTYGAIFSTEPADAAARVPLDGKGVWSRVHASTSSPKGPRTLVFEAAAAVSLLTKLAIGAPLGLHRNDNTGHRTRHTASAAPRTTLVGRKARRQPVVGRRH